MVKMNIQVAKKSETQIKDIKATTTEVVATITIEVQAVGIVDVEEVTILIVEGRSKRHDYDIRYNCNQNNEDLVW